MHDVGPNPNYPNFLTTKLSSADTALPVAHVPHPAVGSCSHRRLFDSGLNGAVLILENWMTLDRQ